MKTLLTLVIALSITTYSVGQINSGAVLLEGTLNYNHSTSDYEISPNSPFSTSKQKSTSFAFRPRVGFFVNEAFVMGLGVSYESTSYAYLSFYDGAPSTPYAEKSSLIALTPYVRQFIPLNEKVYLTITGNVSIGVGKARYGDDSALKNDLFNMRVDVGPGLTYFLSQRWAVTASFGQLFYNYRKESGEAPGGSNEKPKDIDKSYGFNFQFNTIGVGAQYFLGNSD
jgi:hypothetical protein